jgi:dihydropteroate synthase
MREHSLRLSRPGPGTVPEQGRHLLRWSGPELVGILNLTPDSFSDGGELPTPEAALERARAMREAGVLILDLGGESTRPGAEPVAVGDELARVIPAVELLAADGHLISVDTRRAEVARAALAAGAHMINDVGSLRDPAMVAVLAEAAAPGVAMHMRGEPRTMQVDPHYDDVVAEVGASLHAAAERALAAGVPDVVIDPGIGFGKGFDHNLELLARLDELCGGPYPLMLGASRKRFLGRITGVERAGGRDPASVAVHLHGADRGAALLRVHDVAAHRQALDVWRALRG